MTEYLYGWAKDLYKDLAPSEHWNENFMNMLETILRLKFLREILKYILFYKNVFPGMSMALTKEAKNKFLPLKKINSTQLFKSC